MPHFSYVLLRDILLYFHIDFSTFSSSDIKRKETSASFHVMHKEFLTILNLSQNLKRDSHTSACACFVFLARHSVTISYHLSPNIVFPI